jgi:hypothetical protein
MVDEQQEKLEHDRDVSAKRAEALRAKLALEDPARRLDELLAEITATDRYEQFRGLTGRIHHDLDQLDRHLAAAVRVWDTSTSHDSPPLQRIVLYIDDLDRCRSERVVEVLQAVSLLLSLRLFAVVVAVDPPWLLQSLEDHYGQRLLSAGGGRSRALDYLDKIFQLVYTLRPPGNDATESYFRFLLPELEAPAVSAVLGSVRPDTPTGSGARARTPIPEPSVSPEQKTEPAVERDYISQLAEIELSARALFLTDAEHRFMPRLRPLLPTPRAMKRLSNLYRLTRIDAHDQLDDFLGEGDTGPYQAAAVLLAVLVGTPGAASDLLATLTSSSDEGDLDTLDLPLLAGHIDLHAWMKANGPIRNDLATYRKWATIVARYGFETYHLAS